MSDLVALSNKVAEHWWTWMLHMTWQVALIAGVVWVICRLARRSSGEFRHALWGLVLLRLVVPPFLAVPWSPGPVLHSVIAPDAPVEGGSLGIVLAAEASPGREGVRVAFSDPRIVLSHHALAMFLWAFVSAGFLGGVLWKYLRFVSGLRRSCASAPPSYLHAVDGCRSVLGIRRRVAVMVSPRVSTPVLFGLRRPTILLPEDFGKVVLEAQVETVLLHELAHVKRYDLLSGWVAGLLTCLYWFHPMVWMANLMLRREREMACDDVVLRTTGQEGPAYASTILRVAERFDGAVPAAAGFLGVVEVWEDLLSRIRSAGDARRSRRLGRTGAVALVLLAIALMPMGLAQAPKDSAAEPDEIALYYKGVSPEVKEFIRHTAKAFGRGGLWLPEDSAAEWSAAEKSEKAAYYAEVLAGSYGRHQCEALAWAGVLRDESLLAGLIKVAAYHREDQDYDCRPKWMAVAALGRQENEKAVPHLIPLVDHGNLNTRMWARASLYRITGKALGDDKKAWGAWWNGTGKEPKLTEADLQAWVPLEERMAKGGEAGTAAKTAPELVSTTPAIGAVEVEPGLTEIRVSFDQDMRGGFSWTGGGEVYPETSGKPRWVDKRNCVLPVKLEAGRYYRLGINSKSHKNFRGANGIPARVRVLAFATRGASDAMKERIAVPKAVKLVPENGATDVDPGRGTLDVSFDVAMGGGFSWVTLDESFPEMAGKPAWDAQGRHCGMPVKLEPGKDYRLGLNSGNHINFQSQWGMPLSPIVWEFSTKAAE